MATDIVPYGKHHDSQRSARSRERGAVLYVALIVLILLALIGIAGMQVAGMQERMAANYLRGNVAFQAAEGVLRLSEENIQNALYASGAYPADQETCSTTFDPLTWADTQTQQTDHYIRRVDKCFPSSSIVVGQSLAEDTGNIYDVTALSSDAPDAPDSSAILNTVFIP